jgi:HD-like signal output (HDOD) protein
LPNERLQRLLEKVGEVCPVPEAATRVMSVAGDQRANVRQVAEAIAVDPGLAAQLMRIANSSAFGMSGRIRDLEHAVAVVGLGEIRDMAAAMAMLAAFRSHNELAPQLHAVCVLTGALARRLAKELQGVSRSEAFLCGLLSEVGAMACLSVDDNGYLQLWHQAGGNLFLRTELERHRYGGCSYEIGARLLARNNLPADVCEAVGTSSDRHPSTWSVLGRLTVFARVTAPQLVHAIRAGAVNELPLTLVQTAAACGLPGSPDHLLQIALEAGTNAEQALRQSA